VPLPGAQVAFGIWATRVQDYAAYDKAVKGVDPAWRNVEFFGLRVSSGPDHPVTMVSWQEAQQFCRWLTETEQAADLISPQQRYRLPTDWEWNQAVGLRQQGNNSFPARSFRGRFPWGISWPPSAGTANLADAAAKAQFWRMPTIPGYDDGYATTSPVEAFQPNRYGLYDMGGNVCQWCEDWYDSEQQLHLLRGGCWRSFLPGPLLSWHRIVAPDGRENYVGFRCVLDTGAGSTR
jgi:formylglycine-generating enzyme required for sulfatase activity